MISPLIMLASAKSTIGYQFDKTKKSENFNSNLNFQLIISFTMRLDIRAAICICLYLTQFGAEGGHLISKLYK